MIYASGITWVRIPFSESLLLFLFFFAVVRQIFQPTHCRFLSLLHLGFFQGSSRRWSSRNSPYLLSLRRGFPLFDAVLGNFLLRRALAFLSSVSSYRGGVLVLADALPVSALPRGHLFLRSLPPGGLSNYRVSRKSPLPSLPAALLLVGGRAPSYYVLREAASLAVPTVAFLPPDFDSSAIAYPIPLSGRSPQAFSFLFRLVVRALRCRAAVEFCNLPFSRRRRG